MGGLYIVSACNRWRASSATYGTISPNTSTKISSPTSKNRLATRTSTAGHQSSSYRYTKKHTGRQGFQWDAAGSVIATGNFLL